MYNDIAEAVEDLKEKGIRDLSTEEKISKDIQKGKVPAQLKNWKIIETFRFEDGTDPGSESSLYLLELPDKSRGFIILSFGMYKDPEKAAFIDALNKLDQN